MLIFEMVLFLLLCASLLSMLALSDAVAALAVLRQVAPPHRIRTILEGESLLNDTSSLLIYSAKASPQSDM